MKKCESCSDLKQKIRFLKQDVKALKEALLTYGNHTPSCTSLGPVAAYASRRKCNCGFVILAEFVETGKLNLNQVIKNVTKV